MPPPAPLPGFPRRPKPRFLTQMPGYRRLAYALHVLEGSSVYRPLLRRHRVIFIHIPKTGGQSVSQALFGDPDYIGHASLHEYERENPAHLRDFTSFTFARNPFARLLSAYTYLMQVSTRPDDLRMRANILRQYRDFEDFVLIGLGKDETVQGWWHFRPQTSFLRTSAAPGKPDFIGRFETLTADFETLRARLGFGAPLPWLNKSQHATTPYQGAYSPDMARIVADFYCDDMAAFGYQFD